MKVRKKALLSVYDKRQIEGFALGLIKAGYEIVSTGGTTSKLRGAGLPVTELSYVTGVPEMMEGRLKTLHHKVLGGILARRDHESDMEAVAEHGLIPFEIVAVNLYPFAQVAAKPGASFAELVENIDIGGPTLVRAAAKNFRDVVVLVDPDDYGHLLVYLSSGGVPLSFRLEMMRKAFAHTAAYDGTIADELSKRGL